MKALLTSKEAAKYLGYADSTLRKSRVSGDLGGVKAPPTVMIGKTPRYKKEHLDQWIDGLIDWEGNKAVTEDSHE